jgi:hypothetical protein
VGYQLPWISGFGSVAGYNLPAVLQNTGLELSLTSFNFKGTVFNWSTSVSLTIPQNKLVAFPGLLASSYGQQYVVGQPFIGAGFGYQYTGVNPQTGIYNFVTKNASGLPSNPQDLSYITPPAQKFYGSLQNSFSYKSFQLDVFIQFVKQTGYNYEHFFANVPGFLNYNQPTAVLDNWQAIGNTSATEKFTTYRGTPAGQLAGQAYSAFQHSNAAISDASYIRLQNLSLSYKLPAGMQKAIHSQNTKIFLRAQNLFTITKYVGLDPETQGLTLPPLRVITAGINATF